MNILGFAKTLGLLIFFMVVNILVLQLRDTRILLLLFIIVYGASLTTLWWKEVFGRVRFFATLFVSLLILHILFNFSLPLGVKLQTSLDTALQLGLISHIVFVGVRYVSISQIARLFGFLPKNLTLLLVLTVSFVKIMIPQSKAISIAQIARGQKKNGVNILFVGYVSLAVPFVHRVMMRGEQLGLSIVSRGYGYQSTSRKCH
jgi:energy-coupling factor transporter transmembrane protein EcfT